MNDPITVHPGHRLQPAAKIRSLAALIGVCVTAGALSACGALFDDNETGTGQDVAIKEASSVDRYAARPNGGGDMAPVIAFYGATAGNVMPSVPNGIGELITDNPQSSMTTSAPVDRADVFLTSAEAPTPTPTPSKAAPAPAPSTPAPSKPAPAPSTPTPAPSTPTPAPSTPAPAPSTPVPAASTPAPSPAPASRTINSLDTIVNDMKLMNDLALAGIPTNYGWARGPGHVIMGNSPRGTNTPSWWRVNNSYYKSSAYWNAILPWFVVFDGVGNGASNTRVQLRNMKLYIKSKSRGTWKLTSSSTGVSGDLYPKSLQGSDVSRPNLRTESDGSTSVLPPGGNLVFHGWDGFSDIDGSDVGALFITMQARLVVNNSGGPDDRSRAKYLVHVGGDYYPSRSTRVSDLAPAYYFPGVGMSRAKLVTNDWQAFSFTTIDAAIQDPGGVITEAQLRAAPPPLE